MRDETDITHKKPLRSPERLKLLSEEYRVCSQRADEISRTIWQFFFAIVAFSGAGLGFLAKIALGSGTTTTFFVSIVGIMTIDIFRNWRQAAAKWNWQQRRLYERLDVLETKLGFQTNARFDERKGDPYYKRYISKYRHRITQAIAYGWCLFVLLVGIRGLWELSSKSSNANIGTELLRLASTRMQPEKWSFTADFLTFFVPFFAVVISGLLFLLVVSWECEKILSNAYQKAHLLCTLISQLFRERLRWLQSRLGI